MLRAPKGIKGMDAEAVMYRMYGTPRSHGCEGAASHQPQHYPSLSVSAVVIFEASQPVNRSIGGLTEISNGAVFSNVLIPSICRSALAKTAARTFLMTHFSPSVMAEISYSGTT